MTGITGFIFLFILHYFTGRGFIYLFKIELKPLAAFFLSMICGVIIASFYPFILALAHIPITKMNVGIALVAGTILFNITSIRKYNPVNLNPAKIKWNIQLYELPFLLVFIPMMALSAWKCFYFPTFARDMLSGPEAIAAYAVKEHTLLNSVFTLNLESTNNHLKPPFITDLQIIYKMFVYDFGEVWLPLLTIPFVFWMYTLLKEKLHPVLVGFVMLFFMSMPDPYAYTFIVLFDYSNMICYFAGFYFLAQYFENKNNSYFWFATAWFAFATYIRPETLVLVAMAAPLIFYYFRKEQLPVARIAIRIGVLAVVCFVMYYVWMGVFVNHYMPVKFDVGSQIVLGKVSFWQRLTDMTKLFMLGIADNPNQEGLNLRLYGYYFYLFFIILIVDLIFFRKRMNTEARVMLYGIVVVYFGLPLLAYLIPWVDLNNTTKRGLYKMFPLMLLYYRDSGLFSVLSNAIKNWEMPKLIVSKQAPKPQPAAQPKKKGK